MMHVFGVGFGASHTLAICRGKERDEKLCYLSVDV